MVISTSSNRYLPEDSLSALAISIAQGAEAVHIKLTMSADMQIVVLGDTLVNDNTNAVEVYPEKIRKDGSLHVMDLTLQELQQLSLTSDQESPPAQTGVVPSPRPGIRLTTLPDALGLIKTMESRLGRRIEIIAEIKKNWQYLHNNLDISRAVVQLCSQLGYTTKDSGLHIASYDSEELQRIHDQLFVEAGVDLSLLQLTENNSGQETMRFERGRWTHYNYDWLFTKFGLKAVSGYADMISLAPGFVISETGDLLHQEYIEDAHLLGLKIIISHIDQLAEASPDFESRFEVLLDSYLFTTGVDGIFTGNDQPARNFIEKKLQDSSGKQHKTTIELLLENVKRQQQIN